ncbi:acyl-CoA thioesterase [Mumia flava]|uniref:Acyl-CoA thioesterase n=1 Tax=Mumia flava TaxID=1348852 RepID=A0A0B2B1C0_9ACTN|nr:hydroxyphenylacetyl-CoA thioesterase PaaI [Mumia flava]PJJ54319.1 acyl-CoA thioesterase [Mumia flava]
MTEPTQSPPPATPATPEEVARLSAAAMWAEDHASRSLGMEIVACGPGTATVSMLVREDMVNGWGLCHGGLVASVADSAFALACNSHGMVTLAAGFDVTFVEPARRGDLLVARAREVVVRGRGGLYDVDVVRDRDGAVLAVFRGRSRMTSQTNPALERD